MKQLAHVSPGHRSRHGPLSWGRRVLARLAALAVFATSLVFAGPVVAPIPAYASACPGTTGVTVVVDFTQLGGKIKKGCDPKNPATGLAALTAAGFEYSFVPGFPGFVCRINYLPKPCNGAPPTAYWSYWHAKRGGGKWVYSTLGAASYNPAPGTDQGWAFGAGTPPGIPPP